MAKKNSKKKMSALERARHMKVLDAMERVLEFQKGGFEKAAAFEKELGKAFKKKGLDLDAIRSGEEEQPAPDVLESAGQMLPNDWVHGRAGAFRKLPLGMKRMFYRAGMEGRVDPEELFLVAEVLKHEHNYAWDTAIAKALLSLRNPLLRDRGEEETVKPFVPATGAFYSDTTGILA